MKNDVIFENSIRETVNSFDINALWVKEMSSYCQTTSSKSNKKDCCGSLSFGWV